MRISDWSSDVCSSDLHKPALIHSNSPRPTRKASCLNWLADPRVKIKLKNSSARMTEINHPVEIPRRPAIRLNDLRNQCNDLPPPDGFRPFKNRIVCESEATIASPRSEEHTSELQSLMRISY